MTLYVTIVFRVPRLHIVRELLDDFEFHLGLQVTHESYCHFNVRDLLLTDFKFYHFRS